MVSTPFFRSGLPAFVRFDSDAHQRPPGLTGDSFLQNSVWVRAWCTHCRRLRPPCALFFLTGSSGAARRCYPFPRTLWGCYLPPLPVARDMIGSFCSPSRAALVVAQPSFAELTPYHAHTQRDMTLSVPRVAHCSLLQRDPRIAFYPFSFMNVEREGMQLAIVDLRGPDSA